MEQFSLEKYLANPELKIVTRDGSPARIICTDKCDTFGELIIALIKCENGVENIHQYQHLLRLCGLDELADNFKVLEE